MGSDGESAAGARANCRDRPSAVVFREPGRKDRVNVKREKNWDHLAVVSVIQAPGLPDVGQVAVVCQDDERVLGPLEPMTPFGEGNTAKSLRLPAS